MAAKTLKSYMQEAAKAHCDINIFYGVIAILEGGTISPESDRKAQRIIAICKEASANALQRMDDAIADANRRFGTDG